MKAAQSARVRGTRSGANQKPGSAEELIHSASTQSATVRTLGRVLVQSLQQLGIARILIEQLLKHNARLEQELLQSTHREEQARRLAYRDALTGLPNRTLLRDRFSQATSQAKRHHKLVAMLLIDLDGFKGVNDKLGHGAGDKLLCAVGVRLLDSIRAEDTACRYGGDEFVIMLPDIADAGMAAAAAEKIRARLSKPEFIDGYEVRLTASIGTALYPADGKSHEQLIKHADDAMYRAKAGSSGASIRALPARNPVDPTPAVGDRNKVRSVASGR